MCTFLCSKQKHLLAAYPGPFLPAVPIWEEAGKTALLSGPLPVPSLITLQPLAAASGIMSTLTENSPRSSPFSSLLVSLCSLIFSFSLSFLLCIYFFFVSLYCLTSLQVS
jgi:hypothetical protein